MANLGAMTLKAVQRACLGLLLLAPLVAQSEDARLPYRLIHRIQQEQIDLSRIHTNLLLVLQICSTNPSVSYSNLSASINAKAGKIPLSIGPEGVFRVPQRDDLLAEDPWIVFNQPKGTMALNWHAGLAPSLVRQMTNAIHYAPLMRAVRECDDIQEAMRQFFPAAPRLTTVGLQLTFRASEIAPAAILHAKEGNRRLAANAQNQLIIPLDENLMAEDPVLTLTEIPLAVEIATRNSDAAP
jgi:hypothetical protein